MQDTLTTILESGVIAIIRSDAPAGLARAGRALSRGGIRAIEVTMTTPGALDAVSELSEQSGDEFIVGAGSVLDSETARAAILAGAEFLVMPALDADAIRTAKRYGKVVVPGALTPTEVITAWEKGADMVKVFPASLGGPRYIKALKGPLPQVRLVPVGGVSPDNAGDYIRAGACAVALGSSLVNSRLIAEEAWDEISGRAGRCVEAVAEARS
ncbi:MAG: bifunctional 4-hydroxy-2-oxoglutarate aldolase/2-dehydro-3-deoxy-phosphogluconate aldolase [Armatimonadota bacterium]|jgi:2-dehydro-3-deoxyphosphogluconate aldolase/(4S)-4-hydroxy-2-oxoglutarate aldolase